MPEDTFRKGKEQAGESYMSKQIKITLCVILANIFTGYSIGWSAPCAQKLKDPEQSPLPYSISDKEMSWTVIVLIVGAFFGAITGGYTGNLIGRKKGMLLFSFSHMAGCIVTAQASSFAIILLGRTIIGLNGALVVLNVVYIGEIASPIIRGSLLTMTGVCHVAGSLLVYCVGPYISFTGVLYVSAAINCVHVLALCYIPESPVYYLMKGKEVEAKLTLHSLGRSKDIDREIRHMLADKDNALLPKTEENGAKVSQSQWKQLIFEKKNRKAFSITAPLFVLQNGGGVVSIIFYATTIFQNAQSSVDPNIGTIILGVTELFGVMLTPILIDRYGRRVLLLISTGSCCLTMGILGTYFYIEATHNTMIASIRWLPLVLLIICLFTFNVGLVVVPNTLTGEMYSPILRTTVSSISMSLSWMVSMATSSIFGYIVATLNNHGVFWMYSCINGLGFFFTFFVVPETKGKSLSEIGYMLENL